MPEKGAIKKFDYYIIFGFASIAYLLCRASLKIFVPDYEKVVIQTVYHFF